MKKWCRINHLNIAFFARIMWFWWLSIASHKLEEVYKLWFNFSIYIFCFSIIFFVFISILYIAKVYINFKDVKADFMHPVKSNFFPWIGKIFIIFSIWFLSINIEIARYLFIFWVFWQFIFTIIIFRRWMIKNMEIKELNPLWFLPIVWNILVPVAWVKLWYIELSLFFFSIWIIMWFVMFTIMINRIVFHNFLPEKLIPTLIILIAPPSVAMLALMNLNNWEISDIWKIFYYFSLFMFIVIATKINIFSKIKFYMSWWAYSFPIAVLTTATFVFYEKTQYYFLWIIWIILYIILIIITLLLIYKTILWARKKELCIEE